MKRPNFTKQAALNAVKLDGIKKQLKSWLRSEPTDDDLESFADCYDYDGFKMGKNLDSQGWDVDEQLVDLCGWFSHYYHKEEDKLIKQWVSENNIEVPYQVGEFVSFKMQFKDKVGEIVDIDKEKARLVVCVEADGHTKRKIGHHGYLLDVERCTKAEHEAV